jgi:hypothetical protein
MSSRVAYDWIRKRVCMALHTKSTCARSPFFLAKSESALSQQLINDLIACNCIVVVTSYDFGVEFRWLLAHATIYDYKV